MAVLGEGGERRTIRGPVVVFDDLADLSERAAGEFSRVARQSADERGRFFVALAGGSTPRGLYRLLAGDERRSAVPWNQMQVFWGDERCVPPDHPDSNFRMAYEALLAKVAIAAENVHRMRGEDPPEQAAQEYERELRDAFGLTPGELPRFDLILLGLGADAHTASLFPGSPALHEQSRLVAALYVEKLQANRLTLTPPVLNAARRVVFLVAGADKAPALHAVLQGEYNPGRFPAQVVRPLDGDVLWLVDRAAAAALKQQG